MGLKKLRNIAAQIAECENIIQTSSDKREVKNAEDRIVQLSQKITNMKDMIRIDVMVQEILEKN